MRIDEVSIKSRFNLIMSDTPYEFTDEFNLIEMYYEIGMQD